MRIEHKAYEELQKKYQRVLEALKALARRENPKYTKEILRKIMDTMPTSTGAFVEAFIMQHARDVLEEIGE